MKKEIRLEFDAISENEGLARVVVAAFLTQLSLLWRKCRM